MNDTHEVLPMVVNNALDLKTYAQMAVGDANRFNICPSIPFANLRCARESGGTMFPKLVPYEHWETSEKAVKRLLEKHWIIGNMAELAQFTFQYPHEIEKFDSVFALSMDSRWQEPVESGNRIWVAYTSVEGSKRCFRRFRFDLPLDTNKAIIVF